MATSSIFHQVVLDTPEKADAFIKALEESEKDAKQFHNGNSVTRTKLTNDPEEIKKIIDKMKAKNPDQTGKN